MYEMDDSKKKDKLSIVFISAICAKAGILFQIVGEDEDSTDGTMSLLVKMSDGKVFNSFVRIQLKSTSSPNVYSEKDDSIRFKLKTKNYNDLRIRTTTPIILMVLLLPKDKKTWVSLNSEELLVRGRMYWKYLAPGRLSTNRNSVTVSIPKENVVNDLSVIDIMKKVAMEELE